MELVDTHCHLNFDRYDDDRDAVIQRAHSEGVTRIVVPAVDMDSIHDVLALAERYDGIYAAVGVHPTSTASFSDSDLAEIERLAAHPKVVAIGEIGLDYYWDKSPRETQKRALQSQLDLAAKLELPVIIHNRDSSDDLMDMLEAWVNGGLPEAIRTRPGVLHSFSAPQAIAERAVASGFYLGFTGPLTFKKADDLRAIARSTPNDRVLVETDGPFLTPMPYRGKRNQPAYVQFIADRLASLKGLPTDEIARITTENALRLFNLQ